MVSSLREPFEARAAQVPRPGQSRTIQTQALTIGFEESGDSQGFPIILLHGFPDDVRAWDDVTAPLVRRGYRVIVPYLRRVRDHTVS